MKKKIKPIPKFKNEDEERDFWASHDTTKYFDINKPLKISFSRLKPSRKTVTLRLPEWLVDDLKRIANKHDVPYQSLMKIFLADKVREEFAKYNKK